MKWLLTFLLVLSNAVHAENTPWSTSEKALFATYTALSIADWKQTKSFPDYPGIYETNPLLGENPSSKKVDLFFLANIAAVYLISDYANEHRTTFLVVSNVGRAAFVHRNLSLGVKIGF